MDIWSDKDVYKITRTIFLRLGIDNVNIHVNHSDDGIASVIGLNGSFFNVSSCILNLDFDRLTEFDHKEVLFILSHECAHVYHNDMLKNFFWFVTEQILRGKDNEYGPLIDALISGTALLNMAFFNELVPINRIHIKEIELRADEFAVRKITSDLDSAIRCLKHLCNNDLQRESHV